MTYSRNIKWHTKQATGDVVTFEGTRYRVIVCSDLRGFYGGLRAYYMTISEVRR